MSLDPDKRSANNDLVPSLLQPPNQIPRSRLPRRTPLLFTLAASRQLRDMFGALESKSPVEGGKGGGREICEGEGRGYPS